LAPTIGADRRQALRAGQQIPLSFASLARPPAREMPPNGFLSQPLAAKHWQRCTKLLALDGGGKVAADRSRSTQANRLTT